MLKTIVRVYAALLCAVGLAVALFFVPLPNSGNDSWEGWPFSLCGAVLIVLGVGLYRLRSLARTGMLLFSITFTLYFVYELISLIRYDNTGQGLIGLLLLSPVMILSLAGLGILLARPVGTLFSAVPRKSAGE